MKNGHTISQNKKYKIVEDEEQHILLVIEAETDDQGVYECVAVNAVGEARCQCQVLVEAPLVSRQLSKEEMKPRIVEPLKDLVVKEGHSAVFRCRISGCVGE